MIIFIVGAECQLALFVMACAITFCKVQQGMHHANPVAPVCAEVKVLA